MIGPINPQQNIEQERAEGEFFLTLMEFNHISDDAVVRGLVQKATRLAQKIPQYATWPSDAKQFWNAEALCWKGRIDREVRKGIKRELSFLKGRNLDLGAGSYCYTSSSIAVDFADEMLLLNDTSEKVLADIEKPLPFRDGEFDSCTLIFVLSYLHDIEQVLTEAKRVVKVGGRLVIVQSHSPVHSLHRIHFKNDYHDAEINVLLAKHKLSAHSYVKRLNGREILFVIAERGVV